MHTTINRRRFLTTSLASMLLLSACGSVAASSQNASINLEGTTWTLVNLNGNSLPNNLLVTLTFGTNNFNGKGPVNSYFGDYKLQGMTISVSQVGATMMASMDDNLNRLETDYFAALQQATALSLSNDILEITHAGGSLQYKQGAHMPAYPSPDAYPGADIAMANLNNTKWAVVSIAGQTLPADATFQLTFADGRVSGQAVNSFSGSYTINGANLTIGPLVSTKMAGPEPLMQLEISLFEALQRATSFSLSGERLEIKYDGGILILKTA